MPLRVEQDRKNRGRRIDVGVHVIGDDRLRRVGVCAVNRDCDAIDAGMAANSDRMIGRRSGWRYGWPRQRVEQIPGIAGRWLGDLEGRFCRRRRGGRRAGHAASGSPRSSRSPECQHASQQRHDDHRGDGSQHTRMPRADALAAAASGSHACLPQHPGGQVCIGRNRLRGARKQRAQALLKL